MTFKNLRPRDKVTFLIPAGLKLQRTARGYRTVQEWAKKSGKVVLTFSTHVVVNGGRGTPYVVDEGNYLS